MAGYAFEPGEVPQESQEKRPYVPALWETGESDIVKRLSNLSDDEYKQLNAASTPEERKAWEQSIMNGPQKQQGGQSYGQEPINQQQFSGQNPQEETPGETVLRHATRLGTMALTGAGSLPGTLVNSPLSLGNFIYETATNKQSPVPRDLLATSLGLQTQEEMLHHISKLLPKDYLKSEPHSWQSFFDRVASGIGGFFKGPATPGMLPLIKEGGKALAKSSALETGGTVGALPGHLLKMPTLERLGGLFGYAAAAHGINAASKYALPDQAEQLERVTYRLAHHKLDNAHHQTPYDPLEKGFQDLKEDVDKVAKTSKNAQWIEDTQTQINKAMENLGIPAKQRVDRFGNIIAEGEAALQKPESGGLISTRLDKYGKEKPLNLKTKIVNKKIPTKDVLAEKERLMHEVYSKKIHADAMPFLIRERKILQKGIDPAIRQVPGFDYSWKLGEEVHAARMAAKETANNMFLDTPLEKVVDNKLLSNMLGYGSVALLGSFYMQPYKTALMSLGGAAIYGTAKAMQHMIKINTLMEKSPKLAQLGAKLVQAAKSNNRIGYISTLKQFDKVLTKVAPETNEESEEPESSVNLV